LLIKALFYTSKFKNVKTISYDFNNTQVINILYMN